MAHKPDLQTFTRKEGFRKLRSTRNLPSQSSSSSFLPVLCVSLSCRLWWINKDFRAPHSFTGYNVFSSSCWCLARQLELFNGTCYDEDCAECGRFYYKRTDHQQQQEIPTSITSAIISLCIESTVLSVTRRRRRRPRNFHKALPGTGWMEFCKGSCSPAYRVDSYIYIKFKWWHSPQKVFPFRCPREEEETKYRRPPVSCRLKKKKTIKLIWGTSIIKHLFVEVA